MLEDEAEESLEPKNIKGSQGKPVRSQLTQNQREVVFVVLLLLLKHAKVFFEFCCQFSERGVKIRKAVLSAKATTVPLGVLNY